MSGVSELNPMHASAGISKTTMAESSAPSNPSGSGNPAAMSEARAPGGGRSGGRGGGGRGSATDSASRGGLGGRGDGGAGDGAARPSRGRGNRSVQRRTRAVHRIGCDCVLGVGSTASLRRWRHRERLCKNSREAVQEQGLLRPGADLGAAGAKFGSQRQETWQLAHTQAGALCCELYSLF